MKLHSKWIVLVSALVVVAVPTALAAQGVYTWVDKNGVRHYSDTPHNSKATEITVDAPAPVTTPTQSSAPAVATGKNPAGKVHKVPMPATRETPAEREARCGKLRQEVKQLQSARRVEVTENGKKRFVSGEELVKFRQKMRQRMAAACEPPAQE